MMLKYLHIMVLNVLISLNNSSSFTGGSSSDNTESTISITTPIQPIQPIEPTQPIQPIQPIQSRIDYCHMSCEDILTGKKIPHSACDCTISPSCGKNVKIFKPTDEERAIILHFHNSLRNKVASGSRDKSIIKGGATDMFALSYDVNLEYVAECWAKKCESRSDFCRITQNFESVGQNSFLTTYPTCDSSVYILAFDMWFDEISGITLGCVLGYGTCMSVNHFSQMVWAQTTHIGCVRVQISSQVCNIFCNYGPSGNLIGLPIYTVGIPGSKCTARDKTFKNLCAPVPLTHRVEQSGSSNMNCIFNLLSTCLLLPLLKC